jgi:hypothetical protein
MSVRVCYKKKTYEKNNFLASLKLLKKGVESTVHRYGSAPKCHGSPTLTETGVAYLDLYLFELPDLDTDFVNCYKIVREKN